MTNIWSAPLLQSPSSTPTTVAIIVEHNVSAEALMV